MNSSMPTAQRRDRLRELLAKQGLSAALITNLVNIRYLTGFSGSNAGLLVTVDSGDLFATDSRYTLRAMAEAPDVELVDERNCPVGLAKRAVALGLHQLGFESHDVTVDGLQQLRDATDKVDFVGAGKLVEELRLIKDEEEITALAEACSIGDRALADLLAAGGIRAGRTEREVARDLESRILDYGSQTVGWDSVVAFGPNSAIPHHEPTDRPLQTGDFVKLDFGANYQGYHSDMTRTMVLGQPADWQRDIYHLVATAQRKGVAALMVGADFAEVDKVARQIIDDAGYGFGHGLGHGVGLEIHEAPVLGPRSTGKLSASMAVTVEPGVYLPNRGGVRIEDTLVVREGEPQLLTMTTKDLVVL